MDFIFFKSSWIPASAGMTAKNHAFLFVSPAKAGVQFEAFKRKNPPTKWCLDYYGLISNTNALSKLSLRGAERRSNPKKNEIATPFGLAMTGKDTKCFCISNSIV